MLPADYRNIKISPCLHKKNATFSQENVAFFAGGIVIF